MLRPKNQKRKWVRKSIKKHSFSERKPKPHEFILEWLEETLQRGSPPVHLWTRPMFGCTAVYVDDKIVLILRKKEKETQDNGLWIATTPEYHASLKKDFPSLRSISLFGPGPSGWQVLPEDDPGFEDWALQIGQCIVEGDPRIGKIPKKRKKAR